MNQLSEELKKELWKKAQTNGFDASEYRVLLGEINRIIDEKTWITREHLNSIPASMHYDINGNLL